MPLKLIRTGWAGVSLAGIAVGAILCVAPASAAPPPEKSVIEAGVSLGAGLGARLVGGLAADAAKGGVLPALFVQDDRRRGSDRGGGRRSDGDRGRGRGDGARGDGRRNGDGSRGDGRRNGDGARGDRSRGDYNRADNNRGGDGRRDGDRGDSNRGDNDRRDYNRSDNGRRDGDYGRRDNDRRDYNRADNNRGGDGRRDYDRRDNDRRDYGRRDNDRRDYNRRDYDRRDYDRRDYDRGRYDGRRDNRRYGGSGRRYDYGFGHGHGPRRGHGYYCNDHFIFHYFTGYDPYGWRRAYHDGYYPPHGCYSVERIERRRGRRVLVGAFICTDEWGYPYVEFGSEYVLRYY